MSELDLKAQQIAMLVESVDTDERHSLFYAVSEALRRKTQFYTASCFEGMGKLYEGVA